MAQAPWRSLLKQSLDSNKEVSFSRFCQLATVKANGKPAVRTVVYRGFLENSDRLTVTTDTRSTKMNDLTAASSTAYGEVCWYFTDTREQYRLSGELIAVTKDTQDDELKKAWRSTWQSVSPGARTWFTWPPPNEPRTSDDAEFSKPAPSSDEEPYSNFCLLVLDINAVELLRLRENDKLVFQRSTDASGQEKWSDVGRLNP